MLKKALLSSAVALMVLSIAQPLIAADKGMTAVKASLKSITNAEPDAISESVIPGVFEAVFGAQVVYLTADGRYMLEGEIYDIKNRVNVTEDKRKAGRLKAVKTLDKEGMIVFPAKGETKHVITTFTDIDCGYCRKLHDQVKEYNEMGIEIRYAAFPRAGLKSKSFDKAAAVWCAVDRNKAMTFAKGGAKLTQLQALEQVKQKNCKDPIAKHFQTAREIGVTGTPTLVMDNGQVIPGYVPPERLIKMLSEPDKKG